MAHAGQELTDPDTGARLRFVETSQEAVALELTVREGWSAGRPHVHPAQTERMHVSAGVFRARSGGTERELQAGERIEVPPGTAHTIELVGEAGVLEAEFRPALRTAALFETMFSAESPRRPPRFVPGALRAWVESRGFAREIRYLWPRRIGLAATCLALLLLSLRRR